MRFLVLSDIHLGNAKNPTSRIVDHLNKFFEEHRCLISTVDCIFLSGDVYDKLLYYPSDEAVYAVRWLLGLARYCSVNNIKLRILEGTPSHDWKQCSVLDKLIEDSSIDVDFKYIDAVAVETMVDLNTSVLYVPDEWKPTTRETVEDIRNAIRDAGLTKVDVAVMHGQFRFQLPVYKDEHVFIEEEIMDMVNSYIVIGHIHLPAVYERILVPGSFDRLAHGEEEKKGGLLVDTRDMSFGFLENKHATIFKTVEFKRVTDKSLDRLDGIADKLPEGSHLRIVIPRGNNMLDNIKGLSARYPHITVKKTYFKEKKEDDLKTIKEVKLESVELNRNTLPSLLSNKLKSMEPDAALVERALRRFEEMVH